MYIIPVCSHAPAYHNFAAVPCFYVVNYILTITLINEYTNASRKLSYNWTMYIVIYVFTIKSFLYIGWIIYWKLCPSYVHGWILTSSTWNSKEGKGNKFSFLSCCILNIYTETYIQLQFAYIDDISTPLNIIKYVFTSRLLSSIVFICHICINHAQTLWWICWQKISMHEPIHKKI